VSTSAVTVDYTRIRDAASDVAGSTAITAAVNANPDAIIPLTIEFASNTVNDRLRDTGQRDLASTSVQAQTIDIFRGFASDLAVDAETETAVTRIKPLASAVSAEFAVSFLGGRLNDIDLVDSSFAEMTTTAVKTTGTGSIVEAVTTITADNVRVRYADSALAVNCTMTITAVKTTDIVQDLASASTETVSAGRFRDSGATALTTETTVFCEALRFATYGINAVTEFTLTADVFVNKAIQAVGSWTVNSTVSSTATRIRPFSSDFAVTTTVTPTAVKTARTGSALAATTTVPAIPAIKYTGIILTVYANGFTLTAGDVINIDPRLQLVIRPETRYLIINSETRVLTVV
jgi:hypothetical protein